MNNSKDSEQLAKLSRSKSEYKKKNKEEEKKKAGGAVMRRNNTDRKGLFEPRFGRKYREKSKRNKSSKSNKTSYQKIQSWGLEFIEKSEDQIQDLLVPDKVVEIICGESFLFFFTKSKQIYGVGSNTFGQLTLPDHGNIIKPQLLHFSQKIMVSRIFAGSDFAFCLSETNQPYSWGLNIKGQLGLNHFENVSSPTLIKEFTPFLSHKKISSKLKQKKIIPILDEGEFITLIACGALHTLMLTNKSKVFSCGFGENYSLGHNQGETLCKFKEISFFHQLSSASSHKIEKISAGTSHSGAMVAGKVYLWGTFAHSKYCLNKIPNALYINETIIDFVVGDLLTVVLTSSGKVFTVGENTDFQLGHNKENDYNLHEVELPCKMEYVCCGLNHVIAINNSNEKVYGWGSNRYGQIHPDTSFEYFAEPEELPWMCEARAFIITCGFLNTVLVSAKRTKLVPLRDAQDELETVEDLKKQIEMIRQKTKMINQENEKLKEEITTLHNTINSHMDSVSGSGNGEIDSDPEADSKPKIKNK